MVRNEFSFLFGLYPLVQLILGLSRLKSTTKGTPPLNLFAPFMTQSHLDSIGCYQHLSSPQPHADLAIHHCWPLFFITHTLKGPSCPPISDSDSVAYKYNNKDTMALFFRSHLLGYAVCFSSNLSSVSALIWFGTSLIGVFIEGEINLVNW